MYKRIVLAYDGTREGIVALREGALLAKRFDSAVYLLSVLPQGEGLQSAEGIYGEAVEQQIRSYKALLARGVAVLKRMGFEPVAKLVIGEPTPEISAFAREVDADLVVLGHRKKNLLQRWWSGDTGSYVTDHVACSVLVGRYAISDEAFEAEIQALQAKVS